MLSPDDVPEKDKAVYEFGREYGRHEIDNMITWNVNCLGCAAGLDKLYLERYLGYRDGIQDAIAELKRYESGRVMKNLLIKKLEDLLKN